MRLGVLRKAYPGKKLQRNITCCSGFNKTLNFVYQFCIL